MKLFFSFSEVMKLFGIVDKKSKVAWREGENSQYLPIAAYTMRGQPLFSSESVKVAALNIVSARALFGSEPFKVLPKITKPKQREKVES